MLALPYEIGFKTLARIWVILTRLPAENIGSFVVGITAPLGISKVELADSRLLPGFIFEHDALTDVTDISEYGGWRSWLAR